MQHIIQIPLSAEMIEFAAIKAEQHREIQENQKIAFYNSITKGEGNFLCFCGEAAAKVYCGLDFTLNMNHYKHDFIFKEYKIEVKSKFTSVVPRLNYEGSVTDVNKSQGEFYLHTRVYFPHGKNHPPTCVYLMGWIPRKQYFQKASLVKEGQYDSSNNWTCSKDCWNVYYHDMLPMEKIWNLPDRKKHLERQKSLKIQ